MRFKISETTLLAALGVAFWLLIMVAVGGIAVLATLFGSAVTLIVAPVLWLSGKRQGTRKLLSGWGIYLALYLAISTGMALLQVPFANTLTVGEEVCADSGCFAVDKVDRTTAGQETAYTLFWHLSSNDKELTKRFPGKGLEMYMFDERGRKFALPATVNQNPLDVMLPAGETVRQSMTFSVPADARQLFLTAKYRPFTFQSLFPGALSLVPLPSPRIIRIQ